LVTVNNQETMALIDTGAGESFMSERFAESHGIATRIKKEGYALSAIDGADLPPVTRETAPVTLTIGQHQEELRFDVLATARHDVVLGFPWLSERNPVIDWKRRVLKFSSPGCGSQDEPGRRQRSPTDERREIHAVEAHSTSGPEESTTTAETTRSSVAHKARGKEKTDQTPDIPKEYMQWKHLFQDDEDDKPLPPHAPWDLEIILEPDSIPPYQRLRPQSPQHLDNQKKWLNKMIKRGWIRESKSRCASQLMSVPKKDGSSREVVDLRKLNEITIKDRYPLPNIEELRNRLQGANWFTKIDLRDAFYAIRIKEGDEWKTAFNTRWGLYEFLVMPMGFTNAPAAQQRLINHLLQDILDTHVIAYVDDLLIYTNGSLNEHRGHVKMTLERLAKSPWKTAPEKCDFHKAEVEFLGFIIGHNVIKTDPAKVKTIKEWPQPKTVKDVQSFLGLANYVRTYIPGCSKISTPLSELTKKDTPFKWGKEQQEAFQKIKDSIAENTMLRMFDRHLDTQIETDASDLAIGACLTQTVGKQRLPIAFYSRKMAPAEQNYDIHDKELLAIVSALKHWRIYAEGAKNLTVYTDHKNLLTFTTTKELNRRQVRWAQELGEYKFKILYTPGKDNVRADALSRRSDYMETKETFSHSILKRNQDGSLSANIIEVNAIERALEDPDEEFPTHERIRVAEDQEKDVIKALHDNPVSGHPGIEKTLEQIRRRYMFPDMKKKVTRYIARCEQCQKNKHSRHAKYGTIQFSDPPTKPWEEVTMDFVTDLPVSEDHATKTKYNGILVVVDRLTKYSHFIPYRTNFTAPQVASLVIDRCIRHHGIPRRFITDRDKIFTSNFWKTVINEMGIKHSMSTAFHPQTDGQTERINQNIEIYLRHYLDWEQENWVSLLPIAQLALNNHISSTTKVTPFFANYGRHPDLFRDPIPGIKSLEGQKAVKHMQGLYQKCETNIRNMQQNIMIHENENRKNPQLKEGDRVFVLTKNFGTKRNSKKLDAVKVGPFLITKQTSPVNYKVALPADTRKHQVFHISQLELADPAIPLQETFWHEPYEADVFTAEAIVGHKKHKNKEHYLIKWKGYPNSENTWEPKENLLTCQELIKEFWKNHWDNMPLHLRKA